MQSFTEENYLKEIYHLSGVSNQVQTNALAERMQTKAASVTDMIKRLSEKGLVNYVRYQGVTLTEEGKKTAVDIVRKHRLWEVFLVEKLNFKWDQVHDVAEELEHIKSSLLIERLDEFLDYPKADPHGDPIPDRYGNFADNSFIKVSKLKVGESGTITGVSEHSGTFLRHLEKLGLTLGREVSVTEIIDFDGSVELRVANSQVNISKEIAKHLLVSKCI